MIAMRVFDPGHRLCCYSLRSFWLEKRDGFITIIISLLSCV